MPSTDSSDVKGISPNRWAKNSSLNTVELDSNCTQSMAMVGVSAIITLRMALATLKSVSSSWNLTISLFMSAGRKKQLRSSRVFRRIKTYQ